MNKERTSVNTYITVAAVVVVCCVVVAQLGGEG